MSLVKGIHHVSLKCGSPEEYERAKQFYGSIIGLPLIREWNNGQSTLFDTGSGIIEIFSTGKAADGTGSINHFAFFVDEPDTCIETVRAAGYTVTVEPKDVVLGPENDPLPIRVAFCIGPVGEEIEFFCEK